jgi:hypothetical protein
MGLDPSETAPILPRLMLRSCYVRSRQHPTIHNFAPDIGARYQGRSRLIVGCNCRPFLNGVQGVAGSNPAVPIE